MGKLVAVEIGTFPEGLLDTVAQQAGKALKIAVSTLPRKIDHAVAYDAARGQFLAIRLLEELRQVGDHTDRIIGAADVDLFNPVLTFVFGEAEMPGRAAVFSIHRLRQEFYGLPADHRLLAERAAKEMLHELGHTFGLIHCVDAACVMSSSHSVEAVDLKGSVFCERCRATVLSTRPPAVRAAIFPPAARS